jgi:hypothetical protein
MTPLTTPAVSFTGRKAMRAAAQGDFIRPKNTLMSGVAVP